MSNDETKSLKSCLWLCEAVIRHSGAHNDNASMLMLKAGIMFSSSLFSMSTWYWYIINRKYRPDDGTRGKVKGLAQLLQSIPIETWLCAPNFLAILLKVVEPFHSKPEMWAVKCRKSQRITKVITVHPLNNVNVMGKQIRGKPSNCYWDISVWANVAALLTLSSRKPDFNHCWIHPFSLLKPSSRHSMPRE